MSNMLTPVEIPDKVEASVQPQKVHVKGPLGELEHELPDTLEVQYDAEQNEMLVTRHSEERDVRALHGLHRSLLANLVEGVSKGYQKKMEIHGTGYNVNMRGEDTLVLQIGFWGTPIVYPSNILPEAAETVIQFNPMLYLIEAYHAVLAYGRAPSMEVLGVFALATVALLAFAIVLFRRASPEMADVL